MCHIRLKKKVKNTIWPLTKKKKKKSVLNDYIKVLSNKGSAQCWVGPQLTHIASEWVLLCGLLNNNCTCTMCLCQLAYCRVWSAGTLCKDKLINWEPLDWKAVKHTVSHLCCYMYSDPVRPRFVCYWEVFFLLWNRRREANVLCLSVSLQMAKNENRPSDVSACL